jgi:hypothetical protein
MQSEFLASPRIRVPALTPPPSCMSINRIYQGKVIKIEVLRNSHPQIFDAWPEVLWTHHELFQDAVNFYLAAFAAMVPRECTDERWCAFRDTMMRSWETYVGRQGSWKLPFGRVCRVIGCSGDASFDDFRRKLFSLSGINGKVPRLSTINPQRPTRS